jgi:hypothetical protein
VLTITAIVVIAAGVTYLLSLCVNSTVGALATAPGLSMEEEGRMS